jgi:pSer/pThr/pTyr-binding forkhead associated (FHA) protein
VIIDEKFQEEKEGTRFLIGRGSDCDVVLDRKTASSQHAVLEEKDGIAFVRDLGSTNGTFLNGDKLAEGRDHALANGDKVWLVQYTLEVILPESEAETKTDQIEAEPTSKAAPGTDKTLVVNPAGKGGVAGQAADLTALEHGQPRLVVGSRGLRASYNIHQRETVIGRNNEVCDFTIPHDMLSKNHARINLGGGVFRITDLNSANGTYVDGQQVLRPTEITSNMVLRFGEISCLFVSNPPAGEEQKHLDTMEQLANFFVKKGKLATNQTKQMLEECRTQNKNLGELLVFQGILKPEEWVDALKSARTIDLMETGQDNAWTEKLPLLVIVALVVVITVLLVRTCS